MHPHPPHIGMFVGCVDSVVISMASVLMTSLTRLEVHIEENTGKLETLGRCLMTLIRKTSEYSNVIIIIRLLGKTLC